MRYQCDRFPHCDRIPTKVKLVSCHHLHHKIEEWLFKTKFFTTICAVPDNIVLTDILEKKRESFQIFSVLTNQKYTGESKNY